MEKLRVLLAGFLCLVTVVEIAINYSASISGWIDLLIDKLLLIVGVLSQLIPYNRTQNAYIRFIEAQCKLYEIRLIMYIK